MNQFATKWEEELRNSNVSPYYLNKLLNAETDIESVKVVINNIGWSMTKLPEMAKEAISLYSDGLKYNDWFAVRNAARNGHLDTLKYLHSLTDITDGIKACDWQTVRNTNTETKQWINDTFPELIKEYVN